MKRTFDDSLDSEKLTLTTPVNPIIFTICKHELKFDSSYREYTKRRTEYLETAFRQASKEYNNLKKVIAEATDAEKYDKVIDEMRSFGNSTFQKYIEIAHKFLLEQDVYTLTEASLLDRCSNTISNGSFFQKYNKIEERYMEIVATDEELKEYRKLKKATRGYWEGGGFGVGGAIKGAITASIKHCLNGNYGGILFVKTGFFFKQNENSNLEYMRYVDIISVEEKFSTEIIHGQDGQIIRMKSISYAQRNITDLFQYFADINSNRE